MADSSHPARLQPRRRTTEYANRGWILAVMCLALVMVVAGVSMLANALPSIAAGLDASQSSQQWIVDAYALDARRAPAPRRRARRPLRAPRRADRRHRASSASASLLVGARRTPPDRSSASARSRASAPRSSCPARCRPSPACSRPRSGPRRSASGPASPAPAAPSACSCRARCSSSSLGLDLRRHRRRSRPSRCVGVILVVPQHQVRGARRARPARRGALRGRHRPARARHHRRTRPRLERPADAGRPGRRRGLPRRRSCWVELRTDEPLLDPRLFRHRGFATGSASLFLQFFAMFGFFFVSLQFLQLVLGYSTLEAAARAAADELVIMPDLGGRRHAVGAVRPQARSAARASRSSAVGFGAVRDPRHRQRLTGRSCSSRS